MNAHPVAPRWIGVFCLAGSLLLAWPAGAAVLVCGVVRSGGVPVRGANLVALERGVTAVTDTAGSFCLDLAEPGVVTLRAFAVGFEPGERVVSAGADGATVRFELVPLRGAAGSIGTGGTSGAGGSGESRLAPVAPSTAPGSGSPAARSGEELLTSLPVLVTAADSAWLTSKHKGSQWDTLFVLHDELRGRGRFGASADPKTWRKLRQRLSDLEQYWCVHDRPRKRSLGEAPCAYLQRGIALTEARAAVLAGKGLSRDRKVYLQRLAGSREARVAAWAKSVLERVESGTSMRIAPPAETR